MVVVVIVKELFMIDLSCGQCMSESVLCVLKKEEKRRKKKKKEEEEIQVSIACYKKSHNKIM